MLADMLEFLVPGPMRDLPQLSVDLLRTTLLTAQSEAYAAVHKILTDKFTLTIPPPPYAPGQYFTAVVTWSLCCVFCPHLIPTCMYVCDHRRSGAGQAYVDDRGDRKRVPIVSGV